MSGNSTALGRSFMHAHRPLPRLHQKAAWNNSSRSTTGAIPAQPNGDSVEYHVAHVPWNIWTATAAGFEGDASGLYGSALGNVLRRRPDSAFIADGSPVTVSTGKKI